MMTGKANRALAAIYHDSCTHAHTKLFMMLMLTPLQVPQQNNALLSLVNTFVRLPTLPNFIYPMPPFQ
jgi:hypothetical protein